jgi:hypothetical protein
MNRQVQGRSSHGLFITVSELSWRLCIKSHKMSNNFQGIALCLHLHYQSGYAWADTNVFQCHCVGGGVALMFSTLHSRGVLFESRPDSIFPNWACFAIFISLSRRMPGQKLQISNSWICTYDFFQTTDNKIFRYHSLYNKGSSIMQ